MAHRVAADVEIDLDEIWIHVATESSSMDVANRVVDAITERFFLLASFPYAGRVRDHDFGVGSRSFAVGEYVIVYCVEGDEVLILRVVRGKRDLAYILGR